ncbi:hypothetical protein ACIBI8_37380 [Streptomyces sp. NPDC050529]|uniref:hypothetical protein n=1 Tax=Streptomyces sp. NPDC050529 TaxID=3365624 RepID=UPI0037AAB751
MTTMTIGNALTGGQDPDYYNGRADAYDDSAQLTLDHLTVRAGIHADYAHLPYALGYMDRVLELRMEHDAVTAAETELAHTDLVDAR